MYDHIALKEVCPHGWLVRFLHNVNYASLFATELEKLLVNDKLQRRLKEIAPLRQYFKRYKQQKMTFGKLLG